MKEEECQCTYYIADNVTKFVSGASEHANMYWCTLELREVNGENMVGS